MENQSQKLLGNLGCFFAMLMWSFTFPVSEVLLETWGVMALIVTRTMLAVMTLMVIWVWFDGLAKVLSAPWVRGIMVGGVGFGIGAILLLVGQKMSDSVTPAIAAAMMPIAGAAVEVIFDKRRLRLRLIIAIAFALIGGLLAGGVNLGDATFSLGIVFCIIGIFLFAWVTRAATRDFQTLSSIGQTTVTLIGCLIVVIIIYALCLITGLGETHVGSTSSTNLLFLLVMSVASIAIAQLLWIWGADRLGILFASLHMNVAPFYVMAIVVTFMREHWVWSQAFGAIIVGLGVLIAQSHNWRKVHK